MLSDNQESTSRSVRFDPFTTIFVPNVVPSPHVFVHDAIVPGAENRASNPATTLGNPPPDNSNRHIVQAQLNAISKLKILKPSLIDKFITTQAFDCQSAV